MFIVLLTQHKSNRMKSSKTVDNKTLKSNIKLTDQKNKGARKSSIRSISSASNAKKPIKQKSALQTTKNHHVKPENQEKKASSLNSSKLSKIKMSKTLVKILKLRNDGNPEEKSTKSLSKVNKNKSTIMPLYGISKVDTPQHDSKQKSRTNSLHLENNPLDRSQAVREKLDEIMKKHTQTIKNLTNIYQTPMGANNRIIASRYNSVVQSIRNPATSTSLENPGKNKESDTGHQSIPILPVKRKPSAIGPLIPLDRFSSSHTKHGAVLRRGSSKNVSSFSTIGSYSANRIGSLFIIRDEVKTLRDKVDYAIKTKKTFTVCGNYYSIRHALLKRGWIEKFNPLYCPQKVDVNLFKKLQGLSIHELSAGLKDKDLTNIYRQVIMSKMIGNNSVSFYWDLSRDTYRHNAENLKDSLINFISKNPFNYANKQGLCYCAKNAYWFNDPGVSYLRTPRTYSLVNTGDPDEFIKDFKTSAAMSLLKWIIYTHEHKASRLISEGGKVPLSNFHFALRECANFARQLKHEDIDRDIVSASDREWQNFLDHFCRAVHVGNHFKQTGHETELSLVHKARAMLKKLSEVFPQLDMDGHMNIWILKPSYGSRGLGIHFCRTLQYVLKVIKENKNSNYVIQKYIERPLLIYNTKFDIRQWFLISGTQPLTIWIYKECYFRFSSQTYNLRKLHESIHLTNNSVQSKYHNGNRDICLPVHNMWYLKEFKAYLENIGYPDVFEKVIFPGMKECIMAAILSSQDSLQCKSSKCFELHGADFMLTEDFKPWLIEINSKPALNPSTVVTAKLCPLVLEDVVKVIVDHSRNPHSSTGNFELLYRENLVPIPQVELQSLYLEGKPIKLDYFMPAHEELQYKIDSCDSLNVITSVDYMKYIGTEMKKTLQHLLTIIEKERQRRKTLRKDENAAQDQGQSDKDNADYFQNMHSIQSNMKEIEEIFKQDIFGKVGSDENLSKVDQELLNSKVGLVKTTDTQLQSNSKVINDALNVLEKQPDEPTISNVMKIVSGLNFPQEESARAR